MNEHELKGLLTNVTIMQESLNRIAAAICVEIERKKDENVTKGLTICGLCEDGMNVAIGSPDVVCVLDGTTHNERQPGCPDFKDSTHLAPKPACLTPKDPDEEAG